MNGKLITPNYMNDFDAKQARDIVDSLENNELNAVLIDIKSEAEKGQTVLHIYKPLKSKTVTALRDKAFKITELPSGAIQRDGLYYSIRW